MAAFTAERVQDPAATARLMMPGFHPPKRLRAVRTKALPADGSTS
jgi:hypothetical protein